MDRRDGFAAYARLTDLIKAHGPERAAAFVCTMPPEQLATQGRFIVAGEGQQVAGVVIDFVSGSERAAGELRVRLRATRRSPIRIMFAVEA